MTHSDAPGAFAVGFVEVWEPLTAYKTGFCDQVSSTEEHRPVTKQTVEHCVQNYNHTCPLRLGTERVASI